MHPHIPIAGDGNSYLWLDIYGDWHSMFLIRHWKVRKLSLKYTVHPHFCRLISSTESHTHTPTLVLLPFFQTKNLWLTFCIYFHILHVFDIFPCRCAHTHTHRDQLAINCSKTVHDDFTCQVWSSCVKLHTAECDGHREFPVISDKWPWLAADQRSWGLSDLSLQQQTLLQPLGLSAGCPTLSVFL